MQPHGFTTPDILPVLARCDPVASTLLQLQQAVCLSLTCLWAPGVVATSCKTSPELASRRLPAEPECLRCLCCLRAVVTRLEHAWLPQTPCFRQEAPAWTVRRAVQVMQCAVAPTLHMPDMVTLTLHFRHVWKQRRLHLSCLATQRQQRWQTSRCCKVIASARLQGEHCVLHNLQWH